MYFSSLVKRYSSVAAKTISPHTTESILGPHLNVYKPFLYPSTPNSKSSTAALLHQSLKISSSLNNLEATAKAQDASKFSKGPFSALLIFTVSLSGDKTLSRHTP